MDLIAKLQQATLAYDQGHLARAQAACEEILRVEPRQIDALYMLGLLACDTRETQKAIDLFLRVIALDPDHSAAHCNLGTAYKSLGWLNDALASYDSAISVNPTFAEAHYNRGNTLKDMKRLEEALASYDAAIAIRPHLAEAHSNRGIVLSNLGRPDEALASHDRAIRLRPERALAYCNRGNALLAMGRLDEALSSYGRAIALRPDFAPAHVNQSHALMALDRFGEALACCVEALRIDPNLSEGLQNFATILRHIDPRDAKSEIRKLIIRSLESAFIDSESVARASIALLLRDLEKPMREVAQAISNIADLDRLTEGLLVAHLTHCPIIDRQLEVFLTRIRERLLLGPAPAESVASGQNREMSFIVALARQCFMNEYLWRVTRVEEERVERLEHAILQSIARSEAPAVRDLMILATYRPLHEVDEIRTRCTAPAEQRQPVACSHLTHLVLNPAREAELEAGIERLTSIRDDVSVAVRAQYEENPYPRWDSLTVGKSVPYIRKILDEIAPHRPKLHAATDAPRVLIAGCGTGKHALSSALRLERSEVLAIDLSRKSLAYARRKAMEMQVTNVKFAQADILNLAAVEQRFDIIECSGVLHHMTHPSEGLRVLLGMLNPGGFIKLGLYSQLARRHVVRLRERAAAQALPVTRDSIRSLREALLEADTPDIRAIQSARNFYSASAVRDLLFHVHEHRFSIPEMLDLISRARLEFLGFWLSDLRVKQAYARQFPGDPDCVDLGNWHRFEAANPDTFTGMYQFWCRKPV